LGVSKAINRKVLTQLNQKFQKLICAARTGRNLKKDSFAVVAASRVTQLRMGFDPEAVSRTHYTLHLR
jgi:hypothetical protein